MSASREKKQRQGGSAASQRAQAAQQQAEATRRKTIQYTIIGVVVAVLVAALLIWNSGFFQGRMTALTIGGTSYTAAEVNYFYYGSGTYRNAANYGQYFGYDSSRSDRGQVISTSDETGEQVTWYDSFLEAALDNMVAYTALYDAAIKDGYSDADVKDLVQSNVQSFKSTASSYGYGYKQFLQLNFGKFMTPATYEKMLTRTLLASQYRSDHIDALTYTDEDYQAYYSEHTDEMDTFGYSYLYFPAAAVPTTDENGNTIEMTDEEKSAAQEQNLAEAKEKAQAAEKALKNGSKDAAALIEEYELTSANAQASAEGSSLSSIYGEWLKDAGRKAGDVTLIENGTSGFYVVAFHDRRLDDTLSVNVRHILVQAEISDGASAPTDEQLAAAHSKAEDILNQWKNGAATEESFAALAEEKSEDGRNADGSLTTPGGLYEEVIPGNFVTPFNDWLFNEGDRNPGDTGILDVNGSASGAGYYGTHVAYFVSDNPGDYAWEHDVRNTLSSEATQTWQDGLEEGYGATQSGAMEYVGS